MRSARKADLPRVVGKVRRSLREDDGRTLGVVHDEQQHGRGTQRQLRVRDLLFEIVRGHQLLDRRTRREAPDDVLARWNRGTARGTGDGMHSEL
jgi:hypothetical protein